jgi:fatty-acyl-CoA synthase
MNAEGLSERLTRTPTPFALVAEVARRRGHHPALVFMRTPTDGTPVMMTYEDLLAETARAIGALRGLGISQEDGIGILLPTVPEAVVALLAATSVGVAMPLNLLLSAEAMANQLELARTRVAIVAGAHPSIDVGMRLKQAAARLPSLDTILEVPISGGEAPAGWTSLVREATPEFSFSGKSERTALLLHTGGTTGEPKLAELSARNLVAGALLTSAAACWNETDRICSALPLYHVGGLVSCLLNALSTGATVILPGVLGGRDPEILNGIWKLVDVTRASILAMVPTSLVAVADVPIGDSDVSSLRALFTGASPLPVTVSKRLEAKLSRPVCQMYGMTEMSGCCTAQPCDGRFREPAVGFPPLPIQIEIRGADASPATRGEVHLTGPNVFQGYRTKAGLQGRPDTGWVASGDLGELLPDGQLRLIGRSKDVIIRGGHNIDPLMIEETAQRHPAVRMCAAVGVPDQYAGELPALYVTLQPEIPVTAEDIRAFVSSEIAEPPARPKRVFVVDALPLTPLGKVARYKLRQKAAVERLFEELEDFDIEDITCEDATAKRVSVVWRRQPTEQLVMRARSIAAALGLQLTDTLPRMDQRSE